MARIGAQRLGSGRGPIQLASLVAVLAAAAVATFLAIGLSRSGGDDTVLDPAVRELRTTNISLREAGSDSLTGGWSTWSDPELSSIGAPLLAVTGSREQTTILILDRAGASVLGAVAVSDEKPFVALNSTDQTLLVSDVFSLDGVASRSRVIAFDLAEGLATKYVVELPDRLSYTLYRSGAMQMSTDGSVLYYPAVRREEIPSCKVTADAASCDRILVGVVDLEKVAITGFFDMGIGCGTVEFAPIGTRDVIATCAVTGASYIVEPGGAAEEFTSPRGHANERTGVHGLSVLTGRTADGRTFQVLDNGTVVTTDDDRIAQLVEAPERLNSYHVAPLSETTWLFGVLDSSGLATLAGAAVWDSSEPDSIVRLALIGSALSVSPVDEDSVAVLYADKRLEIVSIATGEVLARSRLVVTGVKGLR